MFITFQSILPRAFLVQSFSENRFSIFERNHNLHESKTKPKTIVDYLEQPIKIN